MVRSQRPWYRSARSLRRQQGRCRNRAGGVRTISELGTRATTASKDRLGRPASAAGTGLTEAPPAVALRLSATTRARSANRLLPGFGVWFFRGLLVIPFVFMAPEIILLVLGRPGSVANVSASTADVLGTSSFLLFVMMLSVTPVHTMTGWRWHLILRRDYGVAMFFTAGTDLTLAALTTGDTFPGGPLARIAGHTFLVFGTLSVFLLIPLTLTANRPAMHWLGGNWKSVQRLTYVLWVTILIHLAFLFGLSSFFLDALAVSVPLALMRVPAVRRWWRAARKARAQRVLRFGAAVVLIGLFSVGYMQLVHELATKGSAAFVQRPPSD
jgi:DMSO/TMAO reductase YedYZ heme-binding membrane subunit